MESYLSEVVSSLIPIFFYIFFSHQRALFEALDVPLVSGSAESRYLSMDKLKTRGVLQAYHDVSCAEGLVLNKGTLITVD